MADMLSPLSKTMQIYVSERHTFGTDAVLLSQFAAPKPQEKAVDLCCGCGIIPFLWCLSSPPREVHAVDIQPDAVALCKKSCVHCEIGDFFHPHCADLNHLEDVLPAGAFHLVTCNPPYGEEGRGLKSPLDARRTARHEEGCTIEGMAKAAARLLMFGGRLCLCHRPHRLPGVLEAMRRAGLEPKTLRLCAQRPGRTPFLFLLSARKGGKPFLDVRPTLFLEKETGERTEEIIDIYGAYGEGTK